MSMSHRQLGVLGFLMLIVSGLIALPFGPAPVWPGQAAAASVIAGSLSGVVAYTALTIAMRTGEVGAVTPFRYTRLVFAMIAGIAVFGERPDIWTLAGAGLIIGGVSSLVGLGGGSLTVPFLRWCGVDMHKAVGTSSAVAWPIAVAGTFGFVVSGWGNPLLPAWSLGYVSLPATLGIACTSVFFAPLGARLAHALPVPTLRKVFAVFLYVTAVDMMWGMLH